MSSSKEQESFKCPECGANSMAGAVSMAGATPRPVAVICSECNKRIDFDVLLKANNVTDPNQ